MTMKKKKVLLLATGGTIASVQSDNGLKPGINPKQLIQYIPEVLEYADIEYHQLLDLDSTNIGPEHWKIIVEYIKKVYENYDAFVITHGTDTMAYTAAALSYMIQNSKKPIVITGSQKPISLDVTDAKANLRDSIIYAVDDESEGVTIVFASMVIAGTRAKKTRSKSYNAFSSINFPYLALIQDNKIMRYIKAEKHEGEVDFYTKLDSNVYLLKLTPGISPDILKYLFEKYDGLIFESFGVGGIPASINEEFIELCQIYPDKLIIMATQVAKEGSNMSIYEVGNKIKAQTNFLESYDMTPEAVFAKTMWVLGNKNNSKEELEKNFYSPINYDTIWF